MSSSSRPWNFVIKGRLISKFLSDIGIVVMMVAQSTAQLDLIRYFDLLKAFGFIKRVAKCDFFLLGNDLFCFFTCATCSELPSYTSTLLKCEESKRERKKEQKYRKQVSALTDLSLFFTKEVF